MKEKTYTIRLNANHISMLEQIKTQLNKGMERNLTIDDYAYVIRSCLENYYKKICLDETPLSNNFLEMLDKKTEIVNNKFTTILDEYEQLSTSILSLQDEILEKMMEIK